ncbi:hypothetical protein R4Z10_13530 [Niallia sp. XMNu-256]|uniref:hypothetical protein n=1 Tax=Niallia sp. XMNu-256 TaxID=3082444 RepID=UPI0030D302E0
MIGFLVTVSLTLNLLAFIIIAILFLRQNKLIKMEENLKNPIVEMEDIISAYLLQMKEENDRFISQVNQLNKESQNHSSLNNDADTKVSEKPSEQNDVEIDSLDFQENDRLNLGKALSNQAMIAYQKQNEKITSNLNKSSGIMDKNTAKFEQGYTYSIGEQIKQLKNEGYSIEDIAKKLNKGKTEIELLLKFQGNIRE